MTGLKVSQLSNAAALTGTELTPVVQSGVTRAATVNQLATSVLSAVFIGAVITVNSYADLPAASGYGGKFAWVLTSTGFLLTKKASGWYSSNGTNWLPADPPTSAAAGVSVDTTGFHHSSHNDAQNVLADLDTAIPAVGGANTQVQFNNEGVLGGSASLTFDGTYLTTPNIVTATLNKATASDFSIGNGASASSGDGSAVAVGAGAVASAGNALALGASAQATAMFTVAIGPDAGYGGAVADNEGAFALGPQAYADGAYSSAMGAGAYVSGDFATGVGANANASGANSVTVGAGSANGEGALCISSNFAEADGDYSVAIGNYTVTHGAYSTAIGNNVNAYGDYSMAIGLTSNSNVVSVQGSGSVGFIMQNQYGRTLSANNMMMLLGGTLVIDPSTGSGSGGNITTARAALDIGRATDAIIVPVGTTTQRPAAVNGMIRYNSTSNALEAYINGAWKTITVT